MIWQNREKLETVVAVKRRRQQKQVPLNLSAINATRALLASLIAFCLFLPSVRRLQLIIVGHRRKALGDIESITLTYLYPPLILHQTIGVVAVPA